MNLFKIEVSYILLLGFSSLPLSSAQETLFVFDGEKRSNLFTWSDKTLMLAIKFTLPSNTVNSDQQQTPEPSEEQKPQASENSDLLIAGKSLLQPVVIIP